MACRGSPTGFSGPSPIPLCAACGKPAMSRCGGCKTAGYCSSACQKLDWRVHKEVCSTASATQITGSTTGSWALTVAATVPCLADLVVPQPLCVPLREMCSAVRRGVTATLAIEFDIVMEEVLELNRKAYSIDKARRTAHALAEIKAAKKAGIGKTLQSHAGLLLGLLRSGADPNQSFECPLPGTQNVRRVHSAAYSACVAGDCDGFRLLTAHTTVPLRVNDLTAAYVDDRKVLSLLAVSLRTGSVPLVQALFDAGADPNVVCSGRKDSCMRSYCYIEDAGADACAMLTVLAPRVDFSLACNNLGYSFLHRCIEGACWGNPERWASLAAVALTAGADPNGRSVSPAPPLRPLEVIANVYGCLVHPAYCQEPSLQPRMTRALLAIADALAAAGGDMSARPMEARAVVRGPDDPIASPLDTEHLPHFTGVCMDWAEMACKCGFAELIALGLERGWLRADHACLSSDKMPLIVCAGMTMSGPALPPVLVGAAAGSAFVERRLALIRVLVEAGADPLSASATGLTLALTCARPPLDGHHLPEQLELDAYIVAAQRASFERRFTKPGAEARSGRLDNVEWRCVFRADAESMSVKQLCAMLPEGARMTPPEGNSDDGGAALKAVLVDYVFAFRSLRHIVCERDPVTGSYK